MLWSAFLLGILGSLHCVGMCSPLALALPYARQQRLLMLSQTLKYNFARALTYSIQGGLLGFLGKGILWAGLQQILSVSLGVIFMAIAIYSFNLRNALTLNSPFRKWIPTIQPILGRMLKAKASHFWVGVANGLLPCGLVYWALATSVLMFNPLKGAAFMFFFGIGTMPLMIAAVLGSQYLNRRTLSHLYKILPAYQLLLGFVLIVRGLEVNPSSFWQLHILPLCH